MFTRPENMTPDAVRLDLPIAGMTCASCVRRVEQAIETVPGVADAQVNLATQRATVLYDATLASSSSIAQAVRRAGYNVSADESRDASTKIELNVIGMTCAACVRRIEKALRAAPGVTTAVVNLATHRATVQYQPSRTNPQTIATSIREAGYDVADVPQPMATARGSWDARARTIEDVEQAEQRSVLHDFLLAAALTVPTLVIAMSHGTVTAFEQPWARWLQFALITPVLFGPGRRFLRLAWVALKHRTSDSRAACIEN